MNCEGIFEAFSGISWKKARKTTAGFIGPIRDYCARRCWRRWRASQKMREWNSRIFIP